MKLLSILLTVFGTSVLAYLLLRLGQRLVTRYRQQLLRQSEQSLQSHFVFVRSQYLALGAWGFIASCFSGSLVADSVCLASSDSRAVSRRDALICLALDGAATIGVFTKAIAGLCAVFGLEPTSGLGFASGFAAVTFLQSLPAPLGQELRLLLRRSCGFELQGRI